MSDRLNLNERIIKGKDLTPENLVQFWFFEKTSLNIIAASFIRDFVCPQL
jgi:hypothetical protein